MFLAFLPTVPVGAILSPVSLRLVFKKYMYLTSEFLRNFFFFLILLLWSAFAKNVLECLHWKKHVKAILDILSANSISI